MKQLSLTIAMGIMIVQVLYSQKKEAVILYNSVPVEVVLSNDGEIEQFKQEKPDHLKGYIIDTKPNDPGAAIADLTKLDNSSEFGDVISPQRQFLSFDTGKNTLDAKSLDVLNAAMNRLKQEKNTKLIIKASNPESAAERSLNNERLESCKQYLLTQGIDSTRITTTLSPSVKVADRLTLTFTVE